MIYEKRRVAAGSNSINGTEASLGQLHYFGEVLFVNNEDPTLKMFFTEENFPQSGWTPIGIVVVPSDNHRYFRFVLEVDDETDIRHEFCGVMSLVAMDVNDPENGHITSSSSGARNMYVGYLGDINSNLMNGYVSYSDYAMTNTNLSYIPYQTALRNSDGTYTTAVDGLNVSEANVWPYFGTPYSCGSSPSSRYDTNSFGVHGNNGLIVTAFGSFASTAAVYLSTKDSSVWTDSSISNIIDNFPAFVCCARYKTPGTDSFYDRFKNIYANGYYIYLENGDYFNSTLSENYNDFAGFWYLPEVGELCYIPPRYKQINKILDKLNKKYGTAVDLLQIGSGIDIMSSCFSASTHSKAWYVNCATGEISTYFYGLVRAFMRI